MRITPLVLLPVIPPLLFISVFTFVNLLMGQSVDVIMMQLADLWQVNKPYLQASTWIIGVPIMLFILWKNKDKLKNLMNRQRK